MLLVLLAIGNALGEVTLVLFTTLAPSGAIAVMAMAGILLFSRMDETTYARLNKCLCIPLVFTMVGLVASATHLGNPSNALFVFFRVGSSPLSNEVFAAVLFLACVGLYWLYSFAMRPIKALQRILLVLQVLLGAMFIAMVSMAYSVDTILTWNTFFGPLSLWLNAFTGGPLLLLTTLHCARWNPLFGRFSTLAWIMSLMALIASAITYGFQWMALQRMSNSIADAVQLVPYYVGMVASFVLLCGLGLALVGLTLLKAKRAGKAMGANAAVASGEKNDCKSVNGLEPPKAEEDAIPFCLDVVTLKLSASCVLVFAGIFVMRFAFYMSHMTVGLAV